MNTFLLGVGAQKAGTTWLHRYLSALSGFERGAMKEYHVWNAIFRTDEDAPPVIEGDDTAVREDLRARMIAEPDLYFDHFAAILAGPVRVTADITPAYSALPPEAFARIRDGFRECGIATKVIFLMRDPVERCWSAARMYRRKRQDPAGMGLDQSEAEFTVSYAKSGHAQRRGRYERTIAAVESVFGSDEIFCGFYEQLFDPDCLADLSQFTGLGCRAELARTALNTGPKDGELPAWARQDIAREYAATLDFCSVQFPQARDLWTSYAWI